MCQALCNVSFLLRLEVGTIIFPILQIREIEA